MLSSGYLVPAKTMVKHTLTAETIDVTFLLEPSVNVLRAGSSVWKVVVSDEVNFVFFQKVVVQRPWRLRGRKSKELED